VVEWDRSPAEAKSFAAQLGLARVVICDGAPGGPQIQSLDTK
jgi:hypothetical protein